MNNIIQNKRVISIAENRAKRGLDPINNTVLYDWNNNGVDYGVSGNIILDISLKN